MPFVKVHRYPNAGIVEIEFFERKVPGTRELHAMFGVNVFQIF
jgi:hypothetical protein